MRSPWQLIKGLVSRSKSDDAGATADEITAIPDPRVEPSERHTAPQGESEELTRSPHPTTPDHDDTDRQSASVGADYGKSSTTVQTAPLPLQAAENVAPAEADKPAAVALGDSSLVGEGDTATVTTGSKKARSKAPQTRENLSKQIIVKIAVGQPLPAQKTAVDGAAELDREIDNLRLHLSAKLFEQNKLLRRMIERYGDK
jgi:hypothetical protein